MICPWCDEESPGPWVDSGLRDRPRCPDCDERHLAAAEDRDAVRPFEP